MEDKECGGSELNHLLHDTCLGLCSKHGLAADGVVGGSCLRSGVAGGEQVSQTEVQFRAEHALRLCCRPTVFSAEFDSVSRAQGTASRSAGKDEMNASLRARDD